MILGVVITSSAVAADWNFYGSARLTTFYTDGENRDPKLDYDLQGNSRIGAHVKATETLSARFEYGASNNKANIRLFYGVWNFGGGELLIGQTYGPVWLPVSNQAFAGDNRRGGRFGDTGLAGLGENYTGRIPQIQLRFGDFKLALVQANNKFYSWGAANAPIRSYATRVDFPGIQAKYRFKFEPFDFSLSAAYQTFDARGSEVESYLFAGRVGYTAGPFSLKASGFIGSNMGNISELNVTGTKGRKGYAIVRAPGKGVIDVDSYGYAVVAGYKANEWLDFEAGYGYAKMQIDNLRARHDDALAYYLQGTVTLAPGVTLVPEVGLIDYRGKGQRDSTYYGIKWQINF